MKRILIVPPPKSGGGPSNAILRCLKVVEQSYGIVVTRNIFSLWDSAIWNVGTGIRSDVLRLIKMGRRVVFRVDGCFVKETFERERNQWKPENDKANSLVKRALKEADYVIYQSQFSKQYLDRLFKRKEGTFDIVFNGVDLDVFQPLRIKPNIIPVIGCIGTFRNNRIRTLLSISKKLSFCHKLLLVGRLDNQCTNDLQEFQNASGNLCTIEYVPQVQGDKTLVALHNRIDCFLHPIIGDCCPNSVVEALACGTPVLVPRESGGYELVEEGGIGVDTFDCEDRDRFSDTFAKAISLILSNWYELSLKARQRAVEVLCVRKMAQRYLRALSGF